MSVPPAPVAGPGSNPGSGGGLHNDCPECRQRKCVNCTGWAIDEETDEVVECDCAAGGHL